MIWYSAMLTVAHRPVVQSWNLFSTGLPIQYTPTASNSTLRLTLKSTKAQNLDSSGINILTALSLADIATSTATTHGNRYIPRDGRKNATFATSYLPSHLHFTVTSADDLPIYVVANVLRAMQELTHYLYPLEVVFEVFSDTSPTSLPIASGCLALDCGSQTGVVESGGLQHVNLSATNFTDPPSRSLASSINPISLVELDHIKSLDVAYDELKDARSISDQSFADVADRILANITDLIIANQGDGLLPFYSNQRRLFHYVDTWGSDLGISLLPTNALGVSFTLGQAAMALKTTQNNLTHGPLVESRLRIILDGRMVGWGCLRYQNTSEFRCFMPTPWTAASVGSGKYYHFELGHRRTDRSIESMAAAANAIPDVNSTAT